jgi:hypothetical protein
VEGDRERGRKKIKEGRNGGRKITKIIVLLLVQPFV